MSISVTNTPGAAYSNPYGAAQAEGKQNAAVPANPQDTVSISPEARAAMAKQTARRTRMLPVRSRRTRR